MCPVSRPTAVVCSLKRKGEPEGKAHFLVFSSGCSFCGIQLFTSTLFSIPLPDNGTIPQHVMVTTPVIEGEGEYFTEQIIIFTVLVSINVLLLTFSCGSTNYTSIRHSYSGITTSVAMNCKAFSVKCCFSVVGLVPSVQNDYLD